MQVIITKQGQAVAVTKRDPSRPPTTAREDISRMFDFFSGFAGWERSLDDLEKLYVQAAQEVLQELTERNTHAEQERTAFFSLRWWERAWLRAQGKVPASVKAKLEPTPSLIEVLLLYVEKLRHFHQWMDVKRRTSRFYAGGFEREMEPCKALADRLEARAKMPSATI